jgi:hypothetical protein
MTRAEIKATVNPTTAPIQTRTATKDQFDATTDCVAATAKKTSRNGVVVLPVFVVQG